ncbi:hypothetical protein GCM10010495_73660 [Kitasatospora herbaricolor]|uniref:hypothetical protein n=1 Tax=Kitasatospora herbaricolor TaxID=68217 RepID=UPI0019A6E11B|nr:hypothetical protein [Kitasatospora herbaricolor]GGV45386.1 hypothetical protein GCM10010495_73660 [Kitasatospora herbaricolor]
MIAFAGTDCRPCRSRERCTTAARGTRMLTLRPREVHEVHGVHGVHGVHEHVAAAHSLSTMVNAFVTDDADKVPAEVPWFARKHDLASTVRQLVHGQPFSQVHQPAAQQDGAVARRSGTREGWQVRAFGVLWTG